MKINTITPMIMGLFNHFDLIYFVFNGPAFMRVRVMSKFEVVTVAPSVSYLFSLLLCDNLYQDGTFSFDVRSSAFDVRCSLFHVPCPLPTPHCLLSTSGYLTLV